MRHLPTLPTTMPQPKTVIGWGRRGPIYAIGGASPDGDGADSGTGDGDNGTGDQDGKADQTDTGDGKKPNIDGDVDKDRVARTIAAARAAEKKAKDDAKADRDRLAAVLKAAGLTPDGKTDPADALKTMATERDQAVAKARQNAVELAVYKSAGKAGADADAVLDSRGFLTSVADLDPDAGDFADKVTDALKSAVKANPKLAATQGGQGPARQGADHSGGSGGKQRPAGLGAAIAGRLKSN